MISSYFVGANVFLLFFALDDRLQFDYLHEFMTNINQYGTPGTPVILVGSKSDLGKAVSNDEIQQFVQQHKLLRYVEVSAKTGKNVHYLFEMIT